MGLESIFPKGDLEQICLIVALCLESGEISLEEGVTFHHSSLILPTELTKVNVIKPYPWGIPSWFGGFAHDSDLPRMFFPEFSCGQTPTHSPRPTSHVTFPVNNPFLHLLGRTINCFIFHTPPCTTLITSLSSHTVQV